MTREIRIDGDTAYIPLTRGYEAIIDAADAHLVDGLDWTALVSKRRDGTTRTVYAYRNNYVAPGKSKMALLHRVIMGARDGLQVDHRDGDGLNCKRVNLRIATGSQNNCNQRKGVANTSGCKGVTWDKANQKWRAEIRVDGKRTNLGRHKCLAAAAIAYAKASRALHGEFGRVV